jgi:hypothetical protein
MLPRAFAKNDFPFSISSSNCREFMKSFVAILSLSFILNISAQATPEQEKAFVEKYKTALETKDATTLQSCLYTTGADPMIVGFYKMMQSNGEGDKVSKIDLVELTPDDVKKATAPQDGPSGKVCLNLKPTKKLVIVTEKKDENGSSTNTTENFIAEKEGKFVIPVPGPCK